MNTKLSTYRKFKRMFVNILSLFVILVMAFPATGGVDAQEPNPRMTVSITHDWFRAEEFSPGGNLNLIIYDQFGGDVLWEENRTADGSGFIFVGEWEHPVDLKPGNYLVISDGLTTKDLVLEAVTLDVFDPSMDYLAGTAPPTPGGRPVWVGTGNDNTGCGMDVVADPLSGAWEADFSTQPCDVTEDMWAAAQIFDEDGDASEGNLPRVPTFTVFPEWEAIEGWGWTQDATVHLEIDDPNTGQVPDHSQDAQVVPTPWNPNDIWVRFDFAGLYDVKPGDVVTLSEGAISRTHTVQNLAITGVDEVEDTVAGTADEGVTVYVWPHATGQQVEATAGSGGAWDVDFTGIFDIVPGECGRSEVRDAMGNSTAVDWCVPNPHFSAFPEWESAEGWEWPLDAMIHLTIDDPATETNPDYEQDQPVVVTPWDPNGRWVQFNFNGQYDMKVGDVVTLTDGVTARTHTVRNLSITGLDEDTNIVSGTADEGETIYIWPHATGQQVESIVDSGGTWEADFTGIFDLVPGEGGRSEVRDEFGNATAVDWYVPNPRFVVFPEWEWFDGLDWPNEATVNITVADKPECETTKESWGYFFNGSFGEGCDLEIGDTVTFTDGTTTRTHTVRNLAITKVNHDDDTIKGIADPGAEVYVWPHATGEQQMAIAKTQGAAMGKWNVDFSGIFDLVPGECGRSEIRDVYANSTAVDWCIPTPRIVASESGDWFWTTEFRPGMLDLFIYESADEGAGLLWQGESEADESGFTFVGSDIHGQDLLPGNYLVVSDSESQKSLVLQPISVTVFDTENEIIAGFAPAGSEVWAAAGPQDWQERIMVNADPVTGEWFADFAEIGFDITDDMRSWSYAHVYDGDGDANEGNTPLPGATLIVIANQPDWVDSGITVSAGQSFTIEAFGLMNPCSDTYPNGADYCIFYSPLGAEGVVPYENEFGIFPGPGLHFMGLLGRIGDGEPFYIGESGTFTAEQAGTLWLTPNDNLRTDNQGAYSVLVWLEP